MTATKQIDLRRADALRNRERILDAAERMLERSPSATLVRHRGGRGCGAVHAPPPLPKPRRPARGPSGPPTGQRCRGARWHAAGGAPWSGPPGQPRCHPGLRRRATGAVARAAGRRGAAHRSGSGGAVRSRHRRLTSAAHGRTATPRGEHRGKPGGRAGARRRRSSDLREQLAAFPNAQVYPLWLRGRANGVMIAFGQAVEPLSELARQAAAAITLADRYTDAFARAQRSKQPTAAAEIQQSLLPPRICSDHGWGSCRERAAELRGRGGLVRRDRERRWGLDHACRRIGRLDPGGREQRRRVGCPPSESPQRWRHRRGARRDAPGAPRDARAARGDDSRCRALGIRERRAACGQLRPRGAGDPPRRRRGRAHAISQDPWTRRPSQREAGRADDRRSPRAIAL